MGFRRAAKSKMYVAKQSMEMVCRRAKALRALRQLRGEGREAVYLDPEKANSRAIRNNC